MPAVEVFYFQEDDDKVPLIHWLDRLPAKAQQKCQVRLERLEAMGNDLRRPEADYLRDDIYELRASCQGLTTECSTSFMAEPPLLSLMAL